MEKYLTISRCEDEPYATFPTLQPIVVQRWHKIEVEYVTLKTGENNKPTFSSVQNDKLVGFNAKRWQHEQDHSEAKYIYKF